MIERERERPQRPAVPAEAPNGGEGIEAARSRADRLLQAADDAIARALSGDSERFLQAARQSGGQ